MTVHTAKTEHRCTLCRLPILPSQRYGHSDKVICHLSCAIARGMTVDSHVGEREFMAEWLAVEAGLFVKGKA